MIGITFIMVLILSMISQYTKEGYYSLRRRMPRIKYLKRRMARIPMWYDEFEKDTVEWLATKFNEHKNPRVKAKLENSNYTHWMEIKTALIRLLPVWLRKYMFGIKRCNKAMKFIVITLIFINFLILGYFIHPAFFSTTILYPFVIFGEASGVINGEIQSQSEVQAIAFGDDIVAVQAAIDYAKANNIHKITVSGGTWTGGVGDALVFDGNTSTWEGIRFEGAGIEATILDFSALNGNDAITFSQNGGGVTRCWDVVIKNMTIKGGANANHGINFDYAYGTYMEMVKVEDFTKNNMYGLYYLNCFRSTQIECYIWNNYRGIFTSGSNDLNVWGGQVIRSTDYGIYANATSIDIRGAEIELNDGGGVYIRATRATNIVGCYFEKNVGYDVFLEGIEDAGAGHPQLAAKHRIVGNYHNGGTTLTTVNAILVSGSLYCEIKAGTFINHTGSAILIGYDAGDGLKCHGIITEDNWTGDVWGSGGQTGAADPVLIEITSFAYNTVVKEQDMMGRVTDNGFFTNTLSREVFAVYNNDADGVCAGDTVILDTSVNTGNAVLMTNIAQDELFGVVYDGIVDTLAADILAGNDTIEVNDVYAWLDLEGITVQIRDDVGNTERMTLDSVNTGANTITFTGNLGNNHTVANNTWVLREFDNGDYLNIITKGPTNHLHVDGTTDIAVGSHISTYSVDGVGYKGWDYFIAIALEAYASDNDNGLIKAMVGKHEPIKIRNSFAFGSGGTTEGWQGWNITGAGRSVMGFFHVPPEATEILRLEIWAQAAVTEVDKMGLQIRLRAGQENEAKDTHDINLANQLSETSGFTAGDIIYWKLDTQIAVITGGDDVALECIHEGAVPPDIDSQAHMRNFIVFCA